MKIKLFALLENFFIIAALVVAIYAIWQGAGEQASDPMPPTVSFAVLLVAFIAFVVLAAVSAAVHEHLRSRARVAALVADFKPTLDRVEDEATEVPSMETTVRAKSSTFDFDLDPSLDRSGRPDRYPFLGGFIDRAAHPEFFKSLADDRHLKVVS